MDQKKIFLEGEGDSWFNRNKNLKNKLIDVDIVQRYTKNINGKILEIGCSKGEKLNLMKNNLMGFGIDPSEKAIQEGLREYKDLNLFVGTSDALDFEDDYFEVIIFGFCLYLVDRKLIFKTISEADRVLKDRGFLIITDFDSPLKIKRKYHHFDGVFSYKQQYQDLFLSNPVYTLLEKCSYSHQSDSFHPDADQRVSTVVLYKDINSAYLEI